MKRQRFLNGGKMDPALNKDKEKQYFLVKFQINTNDQASHKSFHKQVPNAISKSLWGWGLELGDKGRR